MKQILALHEKRFGVLFLVSACCISMVLSFLQCASENVAGSGSQAGNGRITCTLYNTDGSVASGASVYLRSHDYTTDISTVTLRKSSTTGINTRTDLHGVFYIDSLYPGIYSIEVNDGSGHAVLLRCTIDDGYTTIFPPHDTLRPTGTISGSIASSNDHQKHLFLQIYGLERIGVCDTMTGEFIIDDVPPGTYSIRAVSASENSEPVKIDSITVKSIETTHIGTIDYHHLSQWEYFRKLFLNTSAEGAGVTGDVVNFPVLIRLRSDNFDFNQAKADGSDLRFAKVDGMPLAYEVERWNTVDMQADIWVKVDTVFGNNSSQYFIMYWGNSDAISESDGSAVFDTADAFQGVWHLCGKGPDIIMDATVNHYDGTPLGMSENEAVAGVIGEARAFDGVTSYITMANTADSRLNFPQDAYYSISSWVYAENIDSIYRAIAGKGHEQYYLQFKCLKNDKATWEFVDYQDKEGWEFSEDSVPPSPGAKEWILLTGVRSGNSQSLYINGDMIVEGAALMPAEHERNTSDDFAIGSHGRSVDIPFYQGWSFFNGLIDEVRVSSSARSNYWIRLCYMNQKSEDNLVEFRN